MSLQELKRRAEVFAAEFWLDYGLTLCVCGVVVLGVLIAARLSAN